MNTHQEKVADEIKIRIRNLSEDIRVSKKSKDFVLYDNDGREIPLKEHLDKLLFALDLFKSFVRKLADLYEEEERKELRKLIDDTEVLNKLLEIHKQAFLKRCGVDEG